MDPDPKKGTRLEVIEGRVQLKRKLDGKIVDVASGHYAVAAVGVEMRVAPLPIDEILLTASQGKATGTEWQLVREDRAFDGQAWEIKGTFNRGAGSNVAVLNEWFKGKGKSRSWVTFTFKADANREYRLLARSHCLETGPLQPSSDEILIQVENGQFFKRPADWPQFSDTLCAFGGFPVIGQQYGWTGGRYDAGNTVALISLRFFQPGLQTIKIHGVETASLRLDSLRLSTTQVDVPKEDDYGPLSAGMRK